jgi:hypothetical protein
MRAARWIKVRGYFKAELYLPSRHLPARDLIGKGYAVSPEVLHLVSHFCKLLDVVLFRHIGS